MHTGLTMDSEERHRFNEGARNVVRTNDIARWISNQVQDLRDLVAPATNQMP
jgi:trehalose-6-phosphate synthase